MQGKEPDNRLSHEEILCIFFVLKKTISGIVKTE